MSCSIATCWPSIRPPGAASGHRLLALDSPSSAIVWTPPSFDPLTSKVFSKWLLWEPGLNGKFYSPNTVDQFLRRDSPSACAGPPNRAT